MATYYEAHHLTPDQIYMLQSILCAVSISSDMPFGRVADLIGVRKMMVFGACFMFLQAIYLARCEEYWEFQIALVLAGIHSGCIKNTTDATMTFTFRSIKNRKERAEAYDYYLAKKSRVGPAAYTIGILAGGSMVYVGGLNWPYYAQPVVYIGSIVVAWRLRQPDQVWVRESLKNIATMMLIDRRDIRAMITLLACVDTFSMLCFWSIQSRLEMAGIPTWAYALVYAAWGGVTWMGARFSHRVRERCGDTVIWMFIILSSSYGAVVAGLTSGVNGVVALLVGLSSVRCFSGFLAGSFLGHALPDAGESRNTELAVASTASTLVYVTLAPPFGDLTEAYGVRATFVGLGIAGLGFGCVALWAFRRAVRQG